ncbi:unnamed protein product [Caenorhabditis auriculariae]|uniref:Serine/threonine specific protein phosphatases domain-containing protein n=1 Tax=Caenorhabditis auriculariae TaxID=2777116 RepID=A0A8S1HKQ3_9PELO|nr:unnamed protein product [Caenorhabditis auriculariae]
MDSYIRIAFFLSVSIFHTNGLSNSTATTVLLNTIFEGVELNLSTEAYGTVSTVPSTYVAKPTATFPVLKLDYDPNIDTPLPLKINQEKFKCFGYRLDNLCRTACVVKHLIRNRPMDQELDIEVFTHFGCDTENQGPAAIDMRSFLCQWTYADGLPYIMEYTILGPDNTTMQVRKRCCWASYCNRNESFPSPRRFFRKETEIIEKTTGFWYVAVAVVTCFLVGFAAYLLHYLLSSRKITNHNDYNPKIDRGLLEKKRYFLGADTKSEIVVTGQMNLKETCELLARVASSSEEIRQNGSRRTAPQTGVLKEPPADKPSLLLPIYTRACGLGHDLQKVSRDPNVSLEFLYRIIEHGPYEYPFTALELIELFEESADVFSSEPSLLELEAGITVIGDIRGRYVDLHRWLQLTGWPPANRLLFLGGVVDVDENGSLECLALICALKIAFPYHVFLLRGAPETLPFVPRGRFHAQISQAVGSCVQRMCSQLPFGAIIGGSLFAVYSGFSPMIKDKNAIRGQFRPAPLDKLSAIQNHLIFSQPSSTVRMYRPYLDSRGDWFGKMAVRQACKAIGVSAIIRGHSPVNNGFLPCWRARLLNLWSAPGKGTSFGAVLYIAPSLKITPILLHDERDVHFNFCKFILQYKNLDICNDRQSLQPFNSQMFNMNRNANTPEDKIDDLLTWLDLNYDAHTKTLSTQSQMKNMTMTQRSTNLGLSSNYYNSHWQNLYELPPPKFRKKCCSFFAMVCTGKMCENANQQIQSKDDDGPWSTHSVVSQGKSRMSVAVVHFLRGLRCDW